MDTPIGIEGDFIETKKNFLFFDVKGLLHPYDRKICFLRYYPDPNGDRIKEGNRYKKVYNLKERYSYLKKNFPEHIFFSEQLDMEVQGVKIENIKNIYTPRELFKQLNKKDKPSNLELHTLNLCNLFISTVNIPEKAIGITGSQMVGLANETSDIDLIVYGTEISLKFQKAIQNIFNESNDCRMYNLEELKNHYQWRAGGSDISFTDFLRSEKRKLHQGKFCGIDFFIRYIKSPEDWQGDFYDYKYKNYGRIKIKAEILDSVDSIFTPCSYKTKFIKMIESTIKKDDFYVKDIREVNSFRGRFCEQARTGETVLLEGKVEKVNHKGEKFFRILLSDQFHDKMIVLND
jgi:predicted nucleotidyltransferase